MSTITPSQHQYRTFEATYLFKLKSANTLTLKILDLSQKCLFKQHLTSHDFDFSDVYEGHFETLLQTLAAKKLIPLQHLPNPSQKVTQQECDKAFQQAIEKTKPHIFVENKDIERFSCSITLEIFQDPVIDEHGHTFEKTAIEEHLKQKNECPLNRQPISSLTPNRLVKETIEEWNKQDPIPTFNNYQKENPRLAETNLQMAQAYTEEGEYQEALEFYTKAFQYTQSWKHYQAIPALFEKMNQPEKAHLARLYLAYYQFKAGDHKQAIQTLESSRKDNKLHASLVLIELYHHTGETKKALELSLETAQRISNEHPEQAIQLHKRILNEHPTEWTVYSLLAVLTQNPLEKVQTFLKGALHALQHQNYRIAEQLTQETRSFSKNSFIDEQVTLDLIQKQQKTPHLKKHLQNLAQALEKSNTRGALQAYKMLFQLENTPQYCQKIVQLYTQLQNPTKELTWSLTYLNLLIQNQEWEQAEKIAQSLLQKGIHPEIPLYEKLEEIYTHWHGHKLEDLWRKLGKAYHDTQQLTLAEKTYRQAYERFQRFEETLSLASLLNELGKTPESVQIYYNASVQALLEQDTEKLSLTTREIQKIDPRMKHLSEIQKTNLLMQLQILKLQQELNQAHQKIESLEKVVQPIKEKAIRKEQQRVAELKRQEERALQEKLERARRAELELKRQEELSKVWFGKAKWAQYFGDIGIEPPLPPNIHEILNASCPFWPNKRVHETHLLTLIPRTVNGKPFTLNSLSELIQKPLGGGKAAKYSNYWDTIQKEYGDTAPNASYWALLTKDVIPDSRSKRYEAQRQLLATYSQKSKLPYEVPLLLETATSLLMEHVQTGTRLYSDNPSTYTRCQERVASHPNTPLVVGGFAAAGLGVGLNDDYEFEYHGVGGCRKF